MNDNADANDVIKPINLKDLYGANDDDDDKNQGDEVDNNDDKNKNVFPNEDDDYDPNKFKNVKKFILFYSCFRDQIQMIQAIWEEMRKILTMKMKSMHIIDKECKIKTKERS